MNKKLMAIFTIVVALGAFNAFAEEGGSGIFGSIGQLGKNVGKDTANVATLGTQPELNDRYRRDRTYDRGYEAAREGEERDYRYDRRGRRVYYD